MKVVYFTHSLRSCWNHGNAHFLRGILRELVARGHHAIAYEQESGWSAANLAADHGEAVLEAWREIYPELTTSVYGDAFDPADACEGADLVLVHEWNEPKLVAALGQHRKRGARYTLLFHDTHHRAVSDPNAVRAFDLSGYDGVLAFGEALADVYRRWGWGKRVFVWHEAADVQLFKPPAEESEREGLVWIGNWGDGERTAELEDYLLKPAAAVGLPLQVHGVRYPEAAISLLAQYGARYRGWLPNVQAPAVFAAHVATVHVPRRFYVQQLAGIPTIRMFEAMACGIPLVTAPWRDSEGLFRVGCDYLSGRSTAEMIACLRALSEDPQMCCELARSGLETIRARHTCGHRVDQLLAIVRSLGELQARDGARSEARV